MVKKTMNSLFLNYLLQSQDNIEANVEKWTKDFNIAENIDEISETLNEHMVFIMACWGEIGWCLPKWKEQEIKLMPFYYHLSLVLYQWHKKQMLI